MFVKFPLLGLAAVACAWTSPVSARSVDFQNFEPSPGSTQTGTLERSPTRARSVSIDTKQDRLAAEFTAMDETGDSTPPLPVPGANWACDAPAYRPSPALTPAAERRRATWYPAMAAAACEWGVPASLLDAVVIQESGYNPAAMSPTGAAGISQLMPSRARLLGVRNIWNPEENLSGSARYLRSLLDEFGRFDLALAAYNAGERRVRAAHQIPHIRETISYVSGILLTMRSALERRVDGGTGTQ